MLNMKIFLNLLITWFTCDFILCLQRFGYSPAEQRLWKRKHKHCSGPNQSPISISSRRAVPVNIPAIEFIYYHNLMPTPLKIHNTGHSVSLITPNDENSTEIPFVFGGKLQSEYEYVGLHFHWGERNNKGAEHVINDIRYPLEMHMIHKSKKYSTVSEALEYKDGLAVLAFFYQIRDADGEEIEGIVRHLRDVGEINDPVSLPYTFTLGSLIRDVNTQRFYTYRGSLTTPKCNPAVTWIVFPDTIPISLNQMARFRSLSNGIEGLLLLDNYRHLQPIGNRKIFLRSVKSRFAKLENLTALESSNIDDSNLDDTDPSF
ncbi:CLUMA_CG000153, isoform A, partial [Clunio marinus]